MTNSYSQPSTAIRCIFRTILLLSLLANPAVVLAHAGHGNEFHEDGSAKATNSIQVDGETAKRLGIKVEPATAIRLAVGIKTTGQIETLPSQKVEVNTPIQEAKVVELLVEPGAVVKKGQPVAVLTCPALVTLRVDSLNKKAEAQADLKKAQTDLRQAQQNYEKYLQIAVAEIAQAQSQVAFAQEKYNKDRVLADNGALPRRNALESQTQLAEAKAKLITANSRRDVIDAEAKLKDAQSSVELAKSKLQLSNANYQTRLSQLGTNANAKGLVTVTSPIDGKIADREATLGQSYNDAGGKLMTIVNDSRVFATANIYEKDLGKVRTGQRVSLKIASLPDRTFSGQITRIASVVEGETRVVPVQAEVDNSSGQLKLGMFAELQVLTDRTPTAILVIPSSAIVDANGKKLVYVQNGNAFLPTEVTLGQTSGDLVEVKSGLFEGDLIVTQRAPQLYAQSLRGGTEGKSQQESSIQNRHSQAGALERAKIQNSLPLWLIGVGGGVAIATVAFMAGRRSKPQQAGAAVAYLPEESSNGSAKATESPEWNDNHHVPHQEPKVTSASKNTQE